MKAFLLAAGEGKRLKPLTDVIPKCLMPICGKPLLQIWLEKLAEADVSEVLINTHHLADSVEEFTRERAFPSPTIRLVHEPTLLGSAGTVSFNRAFITDREPFLIVYADNLTDLHISDFVSFHLRKESFFSIVLFKPPHPESCGIVELDSEDRVINFVEKPDNPKSAWANGGIYMTDYRLLEFLNSGGFADFGYDVLPRLGPRVHGFRHFGFFRDIGTLEQLEMARRDWQQHSGEELQC